MNWTTLGRSNLRISTIGFGAWAVGGRQWGRVDDGESIAAIRRAVELGIDFFDTADIYGFGHSESLLGRTIGANAKVVIATKVGLRWSAKGKIRHDLSAPYIRSACEASLRRLRREAIDVYQIHWPDPATPMSEVIESMDSLVSEGKVRYVGAGNLAPPEIEALAELPWFVSYQGAFNYLNQNAIREIIPWCRRRDIAFIAYEPLAKGMLTGKYRRPPAFGRGDHRQYEAIFTTGFSENLEKLELLAGEAGTAGMTHAQKALTFVLQAGATTAIPGMKTVAQVEENAAAGRAI